MMSNGHITHIVLLRMKLIFLEKNIVMISLLALLLVGLKKEMIVVNGFGMELVMQLVEIVQRNKSVLDTGIAHILKNVVIK